MLGKMSYSVSFNKMLDQFFEWVKTVDYYVKDSQGVNKEWELNMLDNFVEPGRNKLEIYLRTLVEHYDIYKENNILSKDTKWIKDMIYEFKQSTKTSKKNKTNDAKTCTIKSIKYVSDSFKKEMKKFLKWADEECTFIIKSNLGVELNWQDIDLSEFKEPIRNKLQMYIEFVLKNNTIYYNDCIVTNSLEIMNLYKNSTKIIKESQKEITTLHTKKNILNAKKELIHKEIIDNILTEMNEDEICVFNGEIMEALRKYTYDKINEGIRKGLNKIMDKYILISKDCEDSKSEIYEVSKVNEVNEMNEVSDSVSDIYEEELKGEYYKDDELMLSLEKELNAVNLDTDTDINSDNESILLDDIEI